MALPNSYNLKDRLNSDDGNVDYDKRVEDMKSNLRPAYKLVKIAYKRSHLNKRRIYDRKAKQRNFQVGYIFYLYNPARKPGKCSNFHRFWSGPFKITPQVSDLTLLPRNSVFLILAHPVYKMWFIQEPKKVALRNKRNFEEKKTESVQHV
jgi:hypothetical protein